MIAINNQSRLNQALILFFQPDSDFYQIPLTLHAQRYKFLWNLLTGFTIRVRDFYRSSCAPAKFFSINAEVPPA
jgi:hypothetical protein